MQDKQISVDGEENPESHTGIRRGEIRSAAAGLEAVVIAGKQVIGEAGITRGLKALNKLNKKDGFDCPSCAWPDPDDDRSELGEYCENGAKAIAEEATTKKIGADFFAKNSVAELAALSDFEIGKKGRIAEPAYLAKSATHYQPISWDDAFKKIADQLNALSSPNEAIFYTSGRTSNEAAFLYQLFVREYGTNNLPDCSNMCHESSGVALNESLGIGKGSVKLEDFYQAEVIMILGQNPGTNHPRMLTALQRAKKNGAIIISINPIPETGLMGFKNPQQLSGMLGFTTPLTDIFIPVMINGDMPLLQAIEKLLLEEEKLSPGSVFDNAFINKNTEGYTEFLNHLNTLDLTKLIEQSGAEKSVMLKTVQAIKNKKKIIVCWAMGLTQHKNAVDTIKEIVNLLLLKGSIGKPGAGTCPVRGHSNVQGDRTMGIFEKPSPKLLSAIQRNFGFSPPQTHGYDVVNSIKAMHEGKGKVFFAMGGNFLSATPDTHYTAKALRNCKLTVHVSTKLNRSHLVNGEEALILPTLGRSDRDLSGNENQFVTCENSMGVIQASKGVLEPVSDKLLSEPTIVCRLAKATLGSRSKVDWSKYERHYDYIRDDIERTIPGFDNYNERVRKPGGFYLPNCNRDGSFETPSQKAQFNVAHFVDPQLNENEFIMMTVRSHDQFNTTIYGLDDRYRGIYNERRVVLMNAEDIKTQGLKDGDPVDLFNFENGIERVAKNFIVITYPIPKKCTATYFPEANVLVPITSVAEKSNTPVSKGVRIKIRRSS